ncbi:MAG: hypothetical protein OEZ59_14085 [Deltaproteobacteria bacterium]|nr:hypothetical protein [Deltaproteobacteria bacterium]
MPSRPELAQAVKAARWNAIHRAGDRCQECGKPQGWDVRHLERTGILRRIRLVVTRAGAVLCQDCRKNKD